MQGSEHAARAPRPTVRAVAERAGVAVSSVSRVLNGHADVSEALRTRVMAAVTELGYQPNLLAKSLRSGSTGTVGFVVRDITNPLFADIVKGAEMRLREDNYSVLIGNTGLDPSSGADHIEIFLRRRVDGLILTLQSESDESSVAALQRAECPLILLDREVPGLETSSVLCDHFSGVVDAVSDLLRLGHQRIGLIAGSPEIRGGRERVRAYEYAHGRAGTPVAPELVKLGSFEPDQGYASTTELLDLDAPPTAVLTGGIQLTMGSLGALSERDIAPGRDISFVSYDDIDWLRLYSPPISVVRRDTFRMGWLAADLLLRNLRGDRTPRFEPIATTYVERGSVREPGDTHLPRPWPPARDGPSLGDSPLTG